VPILHPPLGLCSRLLDLHMSADLVEEIRRLEDFALRRVKGDPQQQEGFGLH